MKVLVATAMYPTPENPAFGSFIRTQVQSLERAGIDVELLLLSGRHRKLIYPKGIFQLRQRLADDTIDLIHAHYGYVGMVARTQWKVPVIVTYHGDDLLGTRNSRGEITRKSKVASAAGRMLASTVDAAIVQSKEMARKLKRANVYIIPHEVDFEVFRLVKKDLARRMLGMDLDKRYLLFAANPKTSVKNFPFAKATAQRLAERAWSIELLVIHKEPQERLALYMNACDALIFPSYQEGSPNIIKQAMACNLPIVATDVGDVRQVIGQTRGCYICSLDVNEFAHCLNQILDSGERTEGRSDVRHFDYAIVAQQLVELYEEILRKRRRKTNNSNKRM